MKTNYKMLWIDDNFKTLRGDKRKFENYFKKHGITFEPIEIEQNPDEKVVENERFLNAVNDIELDVVLIDFNMSGETGADIINHIRKNMHHYHIPILFYSGDGPQKIQEIIFKANATDKFNISDGIYFCDREDIFRKTQSILDSLIKKEEQPQRVRGLLMDRVSEIDAQILKVLNSDILEQLTEEQANKIKQKFVLDKIKKKENNNHSLLENLVHNSLKEVIQYIINNPCLFDSHLRAELLRNIYKIVDKEKGEILSSFYNDIGQEEKCLSKLRNDYAHQTEKEIGDSHTATRCKYIREETQKHLRNLSEEQFIQTNIQS